MVARIHPQPDALVLVFERDGEPLESQLVCGTPGQVQAGERALLHAIAMLVNLRRLQVGDRLTVTAADGEEPQT
jgi:hypothetical protein